MRVFRDEDGLAANSGLWGRLKQILADSRFLVLLASPGAAKSTGVRKEIELWLELHGVDTILIVLTGGDIRWNDDAADFDTSASNALPPALVGRFAQEPTMVDLRWVGAGNKLSLRDPRFARCIAKLSSPILNVPIERLIGHDLRERRKSRAVATITGAMILVITAFGIAQRSRAAAERLVNLSRHLANESNARAHRQPDLALLLAIEASRVAPTVDARASLLATLETQPALVKYLRGHHGNVPTAVVDAAGTFAVSGDDAGQIRFWSLPGGNLSSTEIHQLDAVGALALSRDGRILASGKGKVIHLWEVATGRQKGEPLPLHRGLVNALTFGPDNLLVSGSSDGELILWDLERGRPAVPALNPGLSAILGLSFSHDDHVLGIAAQSGARMLALRTHTFGPVMESGHAIFDLGFAPDSSVAVFADGSHHLVIQDLADSSLPRRAPRAHASAVQTVAFSGDGQVVLSADSDGFIHRWDRWTLAELSSPWKASDSVGRLVVLPNGRNLLTANWDTTLALWDMTREHGIGEAMPIEQPAGIGALAFLPDGRSLISSGYDKSIARWDLASKQRVDWLVREAEFNILTLDVSPDGTTFAGRNGAKRLVLGRFDSGGEPIPQTTPCQVLSRVVFTNMPGVVAFGSTCGLVEWDVVRNQEVARRALSNNEPVVNVAFNSARRLLAASDRTGVIELFNVQDLAPESAWAVDSKESPTALAFAPDGRHIIATGDDGSISSWNVGSRQLVWHVDARAADAVTLAVSPREEIFATGDRSGAVRFWEFASGQQIGPALAISAGSIDAVAFSRDGRTLASAGRDGKIYLWDATFESWEARACAIAGRNLSTDEAKIFLSADVPPMTCAAPDARQPPE
jgi:WD40 repeat protein